MHAKDAQVRLPGLVFWPQIPELLEFSEPVDLITSGWVV